MGTYNYQDIRYYFWNIDEWISFTLQHMNISAREKFFELLNNYINDSNTHEAVKIAWSKLKASQKGELKALPFLSLTICF